MAPDHEQLPHITAALESNCYMLQWYITRILHKSNCKCHAQQAATNVKCIAHIAKGFKNTPTPTNHDRKKQYGGDRKIVTDF
jgi:hypothetical protein